MIYKIHIFPLQLFYCISFTFMVWGTWILTNDYFLHSLDFSSTLQNRGSGNCPMLIIRDILSCWKIFPLKSFWNIKRVLIRWFQFNEPLIIWQLADSISKHLFTINRMNLAWFYLAAIRDTGAVIFVDLNVRIKVWQNKHELIT